MRWDPGHRRLRAHDVAASAIGDDRLQSMSRGTVSPETFSHGTSAQRVRWFRAGYSAGRPQACDTFGAAQL